MSFKKLPSKSGLTKSVISEEKLEGAALKEKKVPLLKWKKVQTAEGWKRSLKKK